MEVLEDDGEEEVGEVEAAYTKVLGEEDTEDQAAPAPPPTPPSTTPALSPSPLAANDDIATAAVVDTFLGVVTHKMAVTHRAPSTSEAKTMRQVVKRFEGRHRDGVGRADEVQVGGGGGEGLGAGGAEGAGGDVPGAHEEGFGREDREV